MSTLSQTAFKTTFIWNLEKPESEGVNVSGGNLLWCYQGIRAVLEVPGVLGWHRYRQSSSHRCRPSHLKQQQVTEVSVFCMVFILNLINLFSFFVILQNFMKKEKKTNMLFTFLFSIFIVYLLYCIFSCHIQIMATRPASLTFLARLSWVTVLSLHAGTPRRSRDAGLSRCGIAWRSGEPWWTLDPGRPLTSWRTWQRQPWRTRVSLLTSIPREAW